MKYQIVSGTSIQHLEVFVNNEIKHGWIVTGGLAIYEVQPHEMLRPMERLFLQAMILNDKDDAT